MDISSQRSEGGEVTDLSLEGKDLACLNWVRLEAQTLESPLALVPLLMELRDEDCAHTWRSHLPSHGPIDEQTAINLIAAEQKRRPTTFFIYVATHHDGRKETVAAATVSERVQQDFPHEGFPVLARCYIRKEHRGRGLYAETLNHRLSYCLNRWNG